MLFRCLLRLCELRIPSIPSLRLDDEARLREIWSRLKPLKQVPTSLFFGTGDRLKPATSIEPLVKEFAHHRADSYSFADVRDLSRNDPSIHLRLGIRRALLGVTLSIACTPADARDLADDLVRLNRVLFASVDDAVVDGPFSFVEVLDLPFALSRPPRRFGRLSHRSIADAVLLEAEMTSDDAAIVDALQHVPLPSGASRYVDEDFLVITWGDPVRRPVESILEQRYAWYTQNCDLPIDTIYNDLGDREVGISDLAPSEGLTAYSPTAAKAMKALVFDLPEDVREDLARLRQMLDAGRTPAGQPLHHVTLLLPSRDDAIQLEPLATEYGMGVAYVDADNRLWDPFPSEFTGAS